MVYMYVDSGISKIVKCLRPLYSLLFPRRLTDVISEAIVEVFYGKHADAVKEESANALGKVGLILADHSAEFDKWYKWLWTDFEESKKENAQNLYLKSLAAMLRLKPRFGDHVVHMVCEGK